VPTKKKAPPKQSQSQNQNLPATRKLSHEGIAAVLDIARNHPDPSIQLQAWKVLFERAWGKAVTPVAVNLEADVQHSFVVMAPPLRLSSAAWEAAYGRQLQVTDSGCRKLNWN
jgi:hypothetical protein